MTELTENSLLWALRAVKDDADELDEAVFLARLISSGLKVAKITNTDRLKAMGANY